MSTATRNWIAAFYWIGVTMTLACVALVVAGNTDLFGRFEHKGFPLSWVFGGAAVLAFLAAEACHSAFSGATETEERTSPLSAELEAFESRS
jgi:type IV secretory pathway VirB2 component (pilin)